MKSMASDIFSLAPSIQEGQFPNGFGPEVSDPQGIDWKSLRHPREDYRKERLSRYKIYASLVEDLIKKHGSVQKFVTAEFGQELTDCDMSHTLYEFYHNFAKIHTSVVHFQLRNLVWATSCHEMYVVHNNRVVRWNILTGEHDVTLDLTGTHMSSRNHNMGLVHISTSCVKDNLAVAGGFNGEIVLTSAQGDYKWGLRVSNSDNCITNGLELAEGNSGAGLLIAANNDNQVRILDVETQQRVCVFNLEWPSNGAQMCPIHRNVLAVVGDTCNAHLYDMSSKRSIQSFKGHLDYSFAVSWHPNGNLLATGNQDCTARLWDIRHPGQALDVLPSTMSAVRSCRFSPDGLSLAVAEHADFVHLYDIKSGIARGSEIDLFGEISGVSFSPSSRHLFIGIADRMYNSVLCYRKVH